MNFMLPEKVNSIIKLLKANGYEAYAVGGCVRDMQATCTPSIRLRATTGRLLWGVRPQP